MVLHDYLPKRIIGNRNPYIVSVIVFPDMAPN